VWFRAKVEKLKAEMKKKLIGAVRRRLAHAKKAHAKKAHDQKV